MAPAGEGAMALPTVGDGRTSEEEPENRKSGLWASQPQLCWDLSTP